MTDHLGQSVCRPWCTTDENYEVGYVEFMDGARTADEAVDAFLAWCAEEQMMRFEEPDQVEATGPDWWHLNEDAEEFRPGRGPSELQMWTIDITMAGGDIA